MLYQIFITTDLGKTMNLIITANAYLQILRPFMISYIETNITCNVDLNSRSKIDLLGENGMRNVNIELKIEVDMSDPCGCTTGLDKGNGLSS